VNYLSQEITRPPIAPPQAATTPPAADAPPEQWAMRTVNRAVSNEMLKLAQSPPPGFNWELFLGCCAHQIPYHPVYHPFSWRGWVDFGVGALGDMGAHLIDQAYWSLGLTYPTSIEATSSLWGTAPVPPPPGSPEGTRPTSKQVSYPMASTVHYQFPAVGSRPPVKVSWYDGGLFPPRPD